MTDHDISFDKILCKTKNKEIKYGDLIAALRRAKIEKGDTICVHSSLFPLGTPCISGEAYMDAIICAFLEILGEAGTLLMPTFTYSFCKKEIFDVRHTPSTVGILTEYFRTYPGVSRTNHPIFSFAVMGCKKALFLNSGIDAFADDSVYGKLRDIGGKLVLLGAPKGYTFYYLCEQKVKVSHRYFKTFTGTIQDGKDVYECSVPYYVRDLEKRSAEDEGKVHSFLEAEGVETSIPLGRGSISCVKCQDMYQRCIDKLMEDESYFLV